MIIFPQFPLWLQLCFRLYHPIGLFRKVVAYLYVSKTAQIPFTSLHRFRAYRDSNAIILVHRGSNTIILLFIYCIIQHCVQWSIVPQFPLWVHLCIQSCHPIGLCRNISSCVSVCIQNGSNVTPVSILAIIVEHYFYRSQFSL